MEKDPSKFRQLVIDKLKNGEWPFGTPIGYKRGTYRVIEREFNDKLLGSRVKPVMVRDIIVDDEAKEFVLTVFTRYASGLYSAHSLCKEIKAAKTGYPVSSTGLHHILVNRFYIGQMPFEGMLYAHSYPQFISQELFDRCQELLRSKSRVANKVDRKSFPGNQPVFLYSKMIRCSICQGTNLSPERQKGIVYYKCGSKFRRFNEEVNSKHLTKYLREDRVSDCFIKALEDIDSKINLDKFTKSLPHATKTNLLFFKEHCKNWFTSNHDIRTELVKILFKDLSYNGSSLTFSVRSPFNGEMFQDFRSNDICAVISKMGYPVAKEEMVKEEKLDLPKDLLKMTQPVGLELSDINKNILKLCNKSMSNDKLMQYLNISLLELQDALFDLQIEGYIEQDDLGYWRVR